MKKIKYFLLGLLLPICYVNANSNKEIQIYNKLSNCVKMSSSELIYKENIPMLNLSYKQIKNISECGCQSKILEYSSYLKINNIDSEVLRAKFVLESNNLELPLATSKKIIANYNVLVNLYCALAN